MRRADKYFLDSQTCVNIILTAVTMVIHVQMGVGVRGSCWTFPKPEYGRYPEKREKLLEVVIEGVNFAEQWAQWEPVHICALHTLLVYPFSCMSVCPFVRASIHGAVANGCGGPLSDRPGGDDHFWP